MSSCEVDGAMFTLQGLIGALETIKKLMDGDPSNFKVFISVGGDPESISPIRNLMTNSKEGVVFLDAYPSALH